MPYPYRDNRTTDDTYQRYLHRLKERDDAALIIAIILVCGVFIVTAVVGLVTAVIGWLV